MDLMFTKDLVHAGRILHPLHPPASQACCAVPVERGAASRVLAGSHGLGGGVCLLPPIPLLVVYLGGRIPPASFPPSRLIC